MLGMAVDITDRKLAEEAVRESEERFRLVADTAPALIWMSGTDKLCTYFNKPWLEFTGRSLESEFGNGWAEGVHPEDLQRCLDTYTQSFDRREKFRMEYRLQHHHGEYRWILDIGVPRFNQDQSFAGYIGIGVDVTERKHAEEALHESEEQFRTLAEAIPQLCWMAHGDGHIFWYNQRWYTYTGTTPEQMEGWGWQSVHDPQALPLVLERWKTSIATGEPLDMVFPLRAADGVFHPFLTRVTPVKDSEGTVVRWFGTNTDVTELRNAQEALSEMSRKLVQAQEQERARIARELHDDINQRLAMLGIELQQLREHYPELPVEISSRMQELQEQTTQISADVQTLSHDLHSSKLEYLGAIGGMKSWCNEFGGRQGLQIEFKGPESKMSLPPEVGLSLFRVLQEALHNAAKHSGVRRIEVQLREDSREIHLIVRDLGKGFDVETAMQGRGLGLASMQERLRLVGGELSINSQSKGGTTIHARVPLVGDSMRAAG